MASRRSHSDSIWWSADGACACSPPLHRSPVQCRTGFLVGATACRRGGGGGGGARGATGASHGRMAAPASMPRRDGLDSIWPSCSAAAPVTRVMHAHRARRLVCVCETGASQGALREPPGEGPGETGTREKGFSDSRPELDPEKVSARRWTRRSCSRPELDPEVVLPHAELTRSWCSRMRSWREWTGSWTRSWCSACGGGPGAASPHALLPVLTSAFAPHLLRAWRFAARAGRCRNYWRRGRL